MITLQENEKITATMRRHPFFLFLEMIPLLPLLILPILLLIVGQFVDVGSMLERQTDTVVTETGIIARSPVPSVNGESAGSAEWTDEGFVGNTRAVPVLIIAVWLLLLWIAGFVIWTDYYLDVLILTNRHVIDIEQRALFSREVTTLSLDRIQDITVNTEGIFASLFHFGNLEIQTAGAREKIVVRFLRKPEEARQQILATSEK